MKEEQKGASLNPDLLPSGAPQQRRIGGAIRNPNKRRGEQQAEEDGGPEYRAASKCRPPFFPSVSLRVGKWKEKKGRELLPNHLDEAALPSPSALMRADEAGRGPRISK